MSSKTTDDLKLSADPSRNRLMMELATLDPQDPQFAVDVVDRLLPMAVELGASDVHVQPRQQTWELLMRIDGVLLPIGSLRRVGDSDPVTRLMVLAGLPTYRGGQPMEGRLQWSGHGRDDPPSLRLGVFPTVHGPRAAIRLMRRNADYDTIDSLGLSDDVTENLIDLSDQTDGAILLSGPAGSGKTTTLYAILRRIAAQTPRRSVMTIEDPVEAVIDTISQSELDVASGMTLASALRSAVRQDSEVLLVSEIRDPETAEAAMQASLTGHLVFSSLHASDVAASLRRLVQLGVPMHAIRSGVRAIVSQRLLRRLCPQCQGEQSRGEQSRGCRQCLGTRYHGRFAIAQCIRLDGSDPAGESLAEALEAGESLHLMRKGARQAGGMDLFDRVQHSIDLGMTDQSEAYRVLGPNPRTTG